MRLIQVRKGGRKPTPAETDLRTPSGKVLPY